MKVHFTEDGWDDYRHWVETGRAVLAQLNTLIEDCRRSPFKGSASRSR